MKIISSLKFRRITSATVSLFCFFGLFLAASFGASAAVRAETAPGSFVFYVSPEGNDRWDGKAPSRTSEPGGGPFASLERARDVLRDLHRQNPETRDVPAFIFLRGGTYYLNAPFVLTPEDSGTDRAAVTYAAYQNEKPILSGGRRIGGWQLSKINGRPALAADIPEVKAGAWNFHQLWVNGVRCQRAQSPAQGFFEIALPENFDRKGPYNVGQQQFIYVPGSLGRWHNLEDVDILLFHYWVSARLGVAELDENKHLVRFLTGTRRRIADGFERPGESVIPARYRVENALELLDEPGEWYLDRPVGRLYYLPGRDESPSSLEAIAPALGQVMILKGQPEQGRYIENIHFFLLGFSHAEWWLPRKAPGDDQALISLPAAVQCSGGRSVCFERCSVEHVGTYGIEISGGSHNCRIVRCDLHDLGGGGIKVGDPKPSMEGLNTHDVEVSDCSVHSGGRVFPQTVGIWVGESFNNLVAHNEVFDFFYTGISVGWTWGYTPNLARNNIVEGNLVHDIGQDWLSDMAGIYTLGVQPGTVIRGNVVHDVVGHAYGGWGIYLDEGSSEIVVRENLVYRTTDGGFHQHFGRDNLVENNVFAFGRKAQVTRSKEETHLSFTFRKNLVYWNEGDLLAGKWANDKYAMEGNLYFDARKPGDGPIFGTASWSQWRERGHDRTSLLADPQFRDPEKADFAISEESPAGKLGIRSCDWSGAGPRSLR